MDNKNNNAVNNDSYTCDLGAGYIHNDIIIYNINVVRKGRKSLASANFFFSFSAGVKISDRHGDGGREGKFRLSSAVEISVLSRSPRARKTIHECGARGSGRGGSF